MTEAVRTLDLGHSHLTLRGDGIIVLKALDLHIYTINEVKENWAAIRELSGSRRAYILNVAGKYTSIESEVRDFVAMGDHADFIAAECFVIHSLAQRLIANFSFKINKPKVASAFFTDIEKAEKWLVQRMETDSLSAL